MSKPKVFSGIQPSGELHIGNYLGAIVNWVRAQDEKENIFCIVDLHAITVPQDPKRLQERILETAKVLLACGIDPAKSTLFVQSDRPEHSELAWILNCYTYFGEMSRMTQFKDKSTGKGENISVGLFDYPVLMAADILLYDTDEVPVGEDQKQHVEITRDIAERVNKKYGKVFTIPKPDVKKVGARIMSLTDPTKKMSKSDTNENSYILLRDSSETIRKKLAKATTDSENEVRFDPKTKPGISNLLNILSVINQKSIADLEKEYVGMSYGQFKSDVAEAIIKDFAPIKEKLTEYDKNEDQIFAILKSGSQKVAPKAQEVLGRVKKATGLGLNQL